MSRAPLSLVVLGLSLSSSWGNGHATTYRALLKAFTARGHDVLFLERDMPWYANHRDLADPAFCRLAFYKDLLDLHRFRREITEADAVVVGSFVPEGVAVGTFAQEQASGVVGFYDIDTPVTLGKLARGDHEYLTPALVPGYDLYLSFTGGPVLDTLERVYRAPAARRLYCSVDPAAYPARESEKVWDLSYLGTYSPDRQPTLEALLLEPARQAPHLRFAVAGPQYPADMDWPANVERIDHVPPADHPAFYAKSRYTLNVTRGDMIAAGYSPSVRLFEAAATGTPIISDRWAGLDTIFTIGHDILTVTTSREVLAILTTQPEAERARLARAARDTVLARHTAAHRAAELEAHLGEAMSRAGRSERNDRQQRLDRRAAACMPSRHAMIGEMEPR